VKKKGGGSNKTGSQPGKEGYSGSVLMLSKMVSRMISARISRFFLLLSIDSSSARLGSSCVEKKKRRTYQVMTQQNVSAEAEDLESLGQRVESLESWHENDPKIRACCKLAIGRDQACGHAVLNEQIVRRHYVKINETRAMQVAVGEQRAGLCLKEEKQETHVPVRAISTAPARSKSGTSCFA